MAEELELVAEWDVVAIQELLAPGSREVDCGEIGENQAVPRQVRGHPVFAGRSGVVVLLHRRRAASIKAVMSRGGATGTSGMQRPSPLRMAALVIFRSSP